jgi:hypothetical protein
MQGVAITGIVFAAIVFGITAEAVWAVVIR